MPVMDTTDPTGRVLLGLGCGQWARWMPPRAGVGAAIVGYVYDVRRSITQILLMLSLVVGVVAMHSLVACHEHPGPAAVAVTHADGSMAPSSEVASATPHDAMSTSSTVRTQATNLEESTVGSDSGHVLVGASARAVVFVGEVVSAAPPDGSAPGHHSALHDLLHLCLAVLTSLLVLAAVLLVAVLGWRRPRAPGPAESGSRTLGPHAPPSTSVRLAQLCVLRN